MKEEFNMSIRKAKLDDIQNNLLDLYIEGFKYHYGERPDMFFYKSDSDLKDELIDIIKNSNILVIESNSKILGSYKRKY